MAARVGGDEFVILCEGVTDVDELAALAERVIDVGRPADRGRRRRVGAGRASRSAWRWPDGGDVDADRLLIAADPAMYRAKATGGNRYRIHESTGLTGPTGCRSAGPRAAALGPGPSAHRLSWCGGIQAGRAGLEGDDRVVVGRA